MTDYPTREYIIRETTYPDATKQEAIGELVRCKDCKHWRKYTDEQFGECMTTIRDTKVTRSDDYCSESERKDDGNG